MFQVNSTNFKTYLGEYIDHIRFEPIEVLRHGKPVGVFLSRDEYTHFQRLDDTFWAVRAESAIEHGEFLSPEDTLTWIRERLKTPT